MKNHFMSNIDILDYASLFQGDWFAPYSNYGGDIAAPGDGVDGSDTCPGDGGGGPGGPGGPGIPDTYPFL